MVPPVHVCAPHIYALLYVRAYVSFWPYISSTQCVRAYSFQRAEFPLFFFQLHASEDILVLVVKETKLERPGKDCQGCFETHGFHTAGEQQY